MDTKTIFSRPSANCLKPLSVQKRKSEDSSEGCETPAKKPCSPKDVSPNLGCVMDYCSPQAQEDSVSPFAISIPALLDEAQALSKDTLDTSFESTQPLDVKHTIKGETETPPLPEKTKPTKPRPDEKRGSETVISVRDQRPVIRDCEREKRLYVSSVTRHMRENGANQGVMTELQNLMTHVADQTHGADGRQWQHPSDFTRRLTESRTNPQVLDIGVNPQDFNTEECLSPGKWDQEDTDFPTQ